MSTNIKKTKLSLRRETLIELDAETLARANGGFQPLSGDRICPTNPTTIGGKTMELRCAGDQ